VITTLRIGPMLDPLTFPERRAIQRFVMVNVERGGEVTVVQDRAAGIVWAIAKIPGPMLEPAAAGGPAS
jgi:hypothetical protein